MALKIEQNITITGTSTINGENAVSYYATVPTSGGNSYFNMNVTNQALYDANRKEMRKDESEFRAKVYEVEDEIASAE
ncbi:hypothetical protein GYN24_10220 [Lactococcus piscium]|uniref:Prophage protein n=1 Tax=Pseudolactococcus paracarnosus TaxID=2749962 RepID=A0A7L4WCZ1_9LACT|nr:hypothetical protein [Lactococcus paracarnosus]MCJ1994954.1 hypothetical protein [Lactococcus paracarnosus]QDJ28208.1 hypothetical protein BHS01_06595 [Lactococcus paracarnosus]SPC35390.1 conserved hypothetical protein [Lactococcus piscium]